MVDSQSKKLGCDECVWGTWDRARRLEGLQKPGVSGEKQRIYAREMRTSTGVVWKYLPTQNCKSSYSLWNVHHFWLHFQTTSTRETRWIGVLAPNGRKLRGISTWGDRFEPRLVQVEISRAGIWGDFWENFQPWESGLAWTFGWSSLNC